ncbi:MAG: hypothetical protein ACTSWQ_00095, partial [Candidatus Thorarchaeota archaeon]
MPVQEIPLPVGAKNLIPALPTVIRSSKDGNIPVAQLFAGDNFVGEFLEGQWLSSGEDPTYFQYQSVSVLSGSLVFMIDTNSGGTERARWINGQAAFTMAQDSYIDVHLEVFTASENGSIYFFLRGTQGSDDPAGTDDHIFVELRRTTTPAYQIRVGKEIAGNQTIIYAYTSVTNEEGTFRIKFRPDDSKIDVYFHDGSGDVSESSDELTLTSDTLDLDFTVGYPAYVGKADTSTKRYLYSDNIDVYQPDFTLGYEQDPTDYGKGGVKCYDTIGSVTESEWQRVYNEEHAFTGDCVIENGLIRLIVDEAQDYGLELYYWTGSAWSQPLDIIRLYLDTDTISLSYPFLKSIESITRSDSIQIKARLCETSTESSSEYIDFYLTLSRGKYTLDMEIDSVVPKQPMRIIFGDTTNLRWSYCGDATTKDIGDDDLVISSTNNTLTDNFMVHFDDAGAGVLGVLSSSQKPSGGNSAFHSYQGAYISISSFSSTDLLLNPVVQIGLIPFADVDHLFEEAENGTTTGTDDVADGSASGGYKVVLDASGEEVYVSLTGITDLPIGRYLLLVRAKDTAQVANDLQICAANFTDGSYLNENEFYNYFTLTSSWAFYQLRFDMNADDSGDAIHLLVKKMTATTNTISVDHFLVVPLCNANSWPQEVAHNALREATVNFRLTDSATYQLFSGLGLTGQLAGSVYTDAMAINAVETASSISLSGPFTATTIKTGSDNEGIYLGAGDDFRAYHDGTDTYLQNNQGDLIIKSIGNDIILEAADLYSDISGAFQIRDTDDSDVVLMELDTDGRTLKFGSDTDPIIVAGVANYDQFLVLDNGQVKFRTAAEIGSDIGAQLISGTQWTIPVYDSPTSLGDSIIAQHAGADYITIDGYLKLTPDATTT